MRKLVESLIVLLALALVATACPRGGNGGGDGNTGAGSAVLSAVKDRGRVVCGVNNSVPGFGFLDQQGNFSGFDVDFCKAVAAAVLGDATKVDFKALTAEQRFTALQSREIDVLIRNTTWTAKRDGAEGATFTTVTFYDGQGMMVEADSPYRRLSDMRNTTICVLSGTTTELNLESQFRSRKIRYTPLSFEDVDTLREAFIRGRCQGWTSDKSQLAGIRSSFPANQGGPSSVRILEETMSKEPLGPVVREGDFDWYDAVNWTVLATIQAEEFGITSKNVDEIRRTTEDPEIKRFLGRELPPPAPAGGAASPTATATEASPTSTETATSPSPAGTAGSPTATATARGAPFDPGLGLPSDFAYQVIKQVGNYREIYDRNVGPGTALGLVRGLNALWEDGGLLYAPPYR